MIKKKTIDVTVCDLCGVEGEDANIKPVSYLRGLGYQPSTDDPLGQKFKKLYIRKDICNRCRARMDHYFLGLSTEEKEQMVYAGLTEHDGGIDLRGKSELIKPRKPTIEEEEFKFDGAGTYPSFFDRRENFTC